jgi:hypothetical protein
VLLQNLDDLLFSEPALTHLSVSPMGTDSTQKRGHLRGAGQTAVLNGIISVPVMVTMMLIVRNPKVMSKFVIKGPLLWLGWIATAVMSASALGTIVGAIVE